MKNYLDVLKTVRLFKGIEAADLQPLLHSIRPAGTGGLPFCRAQRHVGRAFETQGRRSSKAS